MSEKRKKPKISYLDRPDEEPALVGELAEVYDVLAATYADSGFMDTVTLRSAQAIGRAILARYKEQNELWYVCAELTEDTYSDRLDDMIDRDIHEGVPETVWGDICDFELHNEDIAPDAGTLAMVVESNTVGQYDRYTIPIAWSGESRPVVNMMAVATRFPARPVDMPVLYRTSFRKRVSQREYEEAIELNALTAQGGITGKDLSTYIHDEVDTMDSDARKRYFMSLNLEIEDLYGAENRYVALLDSACPEVLYDHHDPLTGSGLVRYVDDDLRCDVVRIAYTETFDGHVDAISLVAVPQEDNDVLYKIPLEEGRLLIYRQNLGEQS